MSRHVIVPPEVRLMNYSTGKPLQKVDDKGDHVADDPVGMGKWLLRYICVDPSLKDKADRKAVNAVRKKFLSAEPGDIVEVEEDHWERIRKVIDKPTAAANSAIVLEQFSDFDDEWCEAKSKREDAERRVRENFPDLASRYPAPNGKSEAKAEAAAEA